MKKILNVKQAAKILGVSTNTMYKYLNQGTITAARGHGQGSFRIPVHALEVFLGEKINDEALSSLEAGSTSSPVPAAPPPETVADWPYPPTTLAVKVIRCLLLFGLLLVILDLITSRQGSFLGQLARIGLLATLTLLAYQQGGFVKK